MPSKTRELIEEIRPLIGNRALDAVLPSFLFIVVNALWNFQAAMYAALGMVLLIGVIRLSRGESLTYALGGVASVLFAMAVVWFLGRSEGFFLPGLVSGGLTVVLSFLSLLFRRPFTAWSSFIARRWPLGWYWHPRVRPAYTETTILWTVFFALRFWWQTILYQNSQVDTLALVNMLTSWPTMIVLLIITYLYGTWRLRTLNGPSVVEFKSNTPQPWQGQQRGF